MRRTLVKAFRVQEPTVRADSSTSQKMREVPRCRMALSGMNLRAQHDELAARLEAGVHMQGGAGGNDDGCRLHQPVGSRCQKCLLTGSQCGEDHQDVECVQARTQA